MDEQREIQNEKRTQRDYSLAFKLQVIDEVEKGEYTYKQVQNGRDNIYSLIYDQIRTKCIISENKCFNYE